MILGSKVEETTFMLLKTSLIKPLSKTKRANKLISVQIEHMGSQCRIREVPIILFTEELCLKNKLIND